MIEWADRFADLAEDGLEVRIVRLDADRRTVNFRVSGAAAGEALLACLFHRWNEEGAGA